MRRIQNLVHLTFFVLLLFPFALIVINPLTINHDSAMYLDLGRTLLDGGQPYVDYIEINPPLIHYLSMLPVFIGRLIGLHAITTLLLLVSLLSAWAALTVRHLLKIYQPDLDPLSLHLIPIGIGLGNIVVYIYNSYAQREHLLILMVFPFIVMRELRWQRIPIPAKTAIALGIIAGIGLLLKPFYLLALILPELYRWWNNKSRWRCWLAIEVLAGFAISCLYVGHFFLLPAASYDSYFHKVLPSISDGYTAYNGKKFLFPLPPQYILILCILFFILIKQVGKHQSDIWKLAVPITLFAMGSCGVFLYQSKGWFYQAVPSLVSAIILTLILLFLTIFNPEQPRSSSFTVKELQVRSLILCIGTIIVVARTYQFFNKEQLAPVIKQLDLLIDEYSGSQDRLLFIDTSIVPAYPTILQKDRRNAATYPVAYPIAFALRDIKDGQSIYKLAPPQEVQDYLHTVSGDIDRFAPVLIFVPSNKCFACPKNFDLLSYLTSIGFIKATVEPGYSRLATPLDLPWAVFVRQDHMKAHEAYSP